ncbi:kinesin-like protein KIN-14Q isoform X1 [Iris pallida]|uniref:Kinesin-like protein KIN-14Q isoform X1 n=1 Tax=Iris pallida TaxID=29817 RepID=A0AAX6F8I9_IRIPA|nr:kinesin-like protein KIN-14Q isoform X1 [Iris pallida]
MSCVSFKMKGVLLLPWSAKPGRKMVEEATSDTLDGPDWSSNLYICDAINAEEVSAIQVVQSIKGLKSRGIHFPRLDTKSLAPRYMPLQSMFDSASYTEFRQQAHQDVLAQGFTSEQTKEVFDMARDNIQLLSTVLSSSQQDALKVIYLPCIWW